MGVHRVVRTSADFRLLAQEAFGCLVGISRCHSAEEVASVSLEGLESIGVEIVTGLVQESGNAECTDSGVLFSLGGTPGASNHVADSLRKPDAIGARGVQSRKPFFWDGVSGIGGIEGVDQGLLRSGGGFGVRSGWFVPVLSVAGCDGVSVAGFSAAGARVDSSAEAMYAARVVGEHAIERVIELERIGFLEGDAAFLTKERQLILKALSEGYSAAKTSKWLRNLGVPMSVHGVRYHLAQMREHLSVENSRGLLSQAIISGWIDLKRIK
jgi:hypothetical protein